MITKNEINAVQLSATKKDFYQIWNELIDTAAKISERWDPASTNESDPGIVLLKVLTAIADKLNYTVDKNILEAFMPSASQRESMMKLCEMLGYDMKYYQSATCDVKVSYTGDLNKLPENGVGIQQFTALKNDDDDINYLLLKPLVFSKNGELTQVASAIEGQLVEAEGGNPVTINLLDDNHRYYLAETQVAENGIYIYNSSDTTFLEPWTKVSNLNTQTPNTKCFKFGYDSKEGLPYIQFPEDVSHLMEDGLSVRYILTNGANGNISAKTLTTLDSNLEIISSASEDATETATEEVTNQDFSVTNAVASRNGRNPETITQAYNNYKKTIGTFDTLVTCRDYMNKIYQLTDEETHSKPLVSNIIVSDIRDDINNSVVLCSFNEYGISYVSKARPATDGKRAINHFDLILYPFRVYKDFDTKDDFKNSFKLTNENLFEIKSGLEDYKTVSHNIISPVSAEDVKQYLEPTDIACIKNYLRLNASITTTYKVNSIEESLILKNIYAAIYHEFNMRNIDFGEPLDKDMIREVIQNADVRIKNVDMQEPYLYTELHLANGTDYSYANNNGVSAWNKLILNNVLAGRVPLFDYNTEFKTSFDEKAYADQSVYQIYPTDSNKIEKIVSHFNLPISEAADYKLTKNESIMFRKPNLKTTKTYPAYVNYFLHLDKNGAAAIPAAATEANPKPERQADLDTGAYYLATKTSDVEGELVGYINGDKTNRYKFRNAKGTQYDASVTYYTVTLGKDGAPNFISANEDYELKSGDYLYINYTPSTTDEESGQQVQSKPITLKYGSGTIIRPNFNLKDSQELKDSKQSTPSKVMTDAEMSDVSGNELDGNRMYTLGTNEQIELREKNVVILNNKMNVYWERNDEKVEGNKITFEFNEENNKSYTLKAGEYFYYTDAYKNDIAYFGNGTKITKTGDFKLVKEVVDESQLSEDIAMYGAEASIPWVPMNLMNGNSLTVTEYEFKVLAENDTLKSITLNSEVTANQLSNNWVKCDKAEFNINGSDDNVDKVQVTGIDWEVRSLLNFNIGPSVVQTLQKNDSFDLYYVDATVPVQLKPTSADKPLSLKANYLCVKASDTLDAKITTYDTSGYVESENYDLKIKTFELDTNTNISNMNMFGRGGWTNITWTTNSETKTLHINVLANTNGLMMINYNPGSNTVAGKDAYLTADTGFEIFNYDNYDDGDKSLIDPVTHWWRDRHDTKGYHLRPGINIIHFTTSCTVTIHADDNNESTLIISDVDLYNVNISANKTGINPKLCYRKVSESTIIPATLGDILADIATIDTDLSFYYNAYIDNSVKVDLSDKTITSDDQETLVSPLTWYDKNNINNKFVVSEIDADYLKTGITISRSSKL